MSTAILISGQMRTFAKCYANQRWHVYRHLDDPHFFLTVQDNAQAETIDLLRADYGPERVHARLLDDPVLEVTPEISAAWHQAPYANAADAHQLLLQHWYQDQVWLDFVTATSSGIGPPSALHAVVFDTIVRIRPDQWFHSCKVRSTLNGYYSNGVCWSPWWGRFGGINDRFAILDRLGAFAYFTVYPQISGLLAAGCPFHPESLVCAALEKAGVENFDWLAAEFSTLRLDGRMRPPEISQIDLAHASLKAA